MARVIRLPDKGRLLVCTALQGCMRDYARMVEVFEQALIDYGGDVHLIFTGDLIHGPHIEPEDWPDFLGEYSRDASDEQITVSTSFGLFDQNKAFLNPDLSALYRGVRDLRIGHEIQPLYPDKAPARLGGRAKAS